MHDIYLCKSIQEALDHVTGAENITPEIFDKYCKSLNKDETFLIEFLNIIGVENFLSLVSHLGGTTVKIPRPQDIIKQSKKYSKGEYP
jgi:hypothetical protein